MKKKFLSTILILTMVLNVTLPHVNVYAEEINNISQSMIENQLKNDLGEEKANEIMCSGSEHVEYYSSADDQNDNNSVDDLDCPEDGDNQDKDNSGIVEPEGSDNNKGEYEEEPEGDNKPNAGEEQDGDGSKEEQNTNSSSIDQSSDNENSIIDGSTKENSSDENNDGESSSNDSSIESISTTESSAKDTTTTEHGSESSSSMPHQLQEIK